MNTAPAAGAPHAAEVLAGYAAPLRFEQLSPAAVRHAKACLIDAAACAIFGARFPWSRAVVDVIVASGGSGACSVPSLDARLDPRQAALALGAFAHAFELDSLCKPGIGVHPGATVALPAFAMAQAKARSGRDLIVAIVAGCEVAFRIGAATLHTPELHGFHAPGITGPFGSAAASASLLKLSPQRLACALGIAGSLAGGLLAFAKSGQGGMVKRLHLGRAAEGGVLAAQLAAHGYEGPLSVLEGQFGVLESFCSGSDPALLTGRLGTFFEITCLCLKRYACHVMAQDPIELLRELMHEHGFAGGEIAAMTIVAAPKVVSHHLERRPADIMLAQYSVPFSLALAAYRDPEDPNSFSDDAVHDPAILELAARICIAAEEGLGFGARMSIKLHDGRNLSGRIDSFRGCPETPLSIDDLVMKFRSLARGSERGEVLLAALLDIENVADVATLQF